MSGSCLFSSLSLIYVQCDECSKSPDIFKAQLELRDPILHRGLLREPHAHSLYENWSNHSLVRGTQEMMVPNRTRRVEVYTDNWAAKGA